MYKLFTTINQDAYPVLRDGSLDYVRRRFQSELDKIKLYHRQRESKVDNTHLLVRLINTMDIDYNLDFWTYLSRIDANALYTSKHFNIVSRVSSGKLHKDVFFGNSEEVLIYVEDDVDLDVVAVEWELLEPVRVLKYPGTGLWMNVPDTDNEFLLTGLSTFTIDVKKLMLKYRFWALSRMNTNFSTSPATFIYQCVLPNMLDSMLDIAVFNRFTHLANNEVMFDYGAKHPFHVMDLHSKIDDILKDVIKALKDKPKYYEEFLKYIPAIVKDNMYDVLHADLGMTNRQSRWSIYVTYMGYIERIISIGGEKAMKRNKQHLNSLRIENKLLSNDKLLDNKLTGFSEFEIDGYLKSIIDMIGRR